MKLQKRKFELGGSVVEQLTSPLKHKNYIIMMDNYFTSLDLSEYLKLHDTFACGTVCPNSSALPELAAENNLQRGEFHHQIFNHGIS
jgi:hypothetical protein